MRGGPGPCPPPAPSDLAPLSFPFLPLSSPPSPRHPLAALADSLGVLQRWTPATPAPASTEAAVRTVVGPTCASAQRASSATTARQVGLPAPRTPVHPAPCPATGRAPPGTGQAHGRPRGLPLPVPHGESPSLVSLFGPLKDRARDKVFPGHGLRQPPPHRLPPRHPVSLLCVSPGWVA